MLHDFFVLCYHLFCVCAVDNGIRLHDYAVSVRTIFTSRSSISVVSMASSISRTYAYLKWFQLFPEEVEDTDNFCQRNVHICNWRKGEKA